MDISVVVFSMLLVYFHFPYELYTQALDVKYSTIPFSTSRMFGHTLLVEKSNQNDWQIWRIKLVYFKFVLYSYCVFIQSLFIFIIKQLFYSLLLWLIAHGLE